MSGLSDNFVRFWMIKMLSQYEICFQEQYQWYKAGADPDFWKGGEGVESK